MYPRPASDLALAAPPPAPSPAQPATQPRPHTGTDSHANACAARAAGTRPHDGAAPKGLTLFVFTDPVHCAPAAGSSRYWMRSPRPAGRSTRATRMPPWVEAKRGMLLMPTIFFGVAGKEVKRVTSPSACAT